MKARNFPAEYVVLRWSSPSEHVLDLSVPLLVDSLGSYEYSQRRLEGALNVVLLPSLVHPYRVAPQDKRYSVSMDQFIADVHVLLQNRKDIQPDQVRNYSLKSGFNRNQN